MDNDLQLLLNSIQSDDTMPGNINYQLPTNLETPNVNSGSVVTQKSLLGAIKNLPNQTTDNQNVTPNSATQGGSVKPASPESQKIYTPEELAKFTKYNSINPNLTHNTYNLGTELLGWKEYYQQHQNARDAAQAQYNSTEDDAQKSQWKKEIEKAEAGMKYANEQANRVRALGDRQGVGANLEALFGSGRTLSESQGALRDIQYDAINKLLNGEQYRRNSEEVFNEKFLEYRRQGMSTRDATVLAAEEAMNYQANRLAAYEQGFRTFGRDGDKLSNAGIDLLTKIQQERPSDVGMYWNGYAHPANQFENDFKTVMAGYLHELGVEDKEIQNMLDMNRDTHQSGLRINEKGVDFKYSSALSKQAFDQSSALQAQAARETLNRILTEYTLDDLKDAKKKKDFDDACDVLGLSPEARAKLKLGLKDKEEKFTDQDNAVNGELADINTLIRNSDFDQAEEKLNELERIVKDLEGNYAGKVSPTTRDKIDAMKAELAQAKAYTAQNKNLPTQPTQTNQKTTTTNKKYEIRQVGVDHNGVPKYEVVNPDTPKQNGTTQGITSDSKEWSKRANFTGYGGAYIPNK